MGTMARIGLLKDDGTVKSSYVNYDGYFEHTGRILFNNYKDVNKINKLLKLGELAELGTEPIGILAYSKDYDETKCRVYDNSNDWGRSAKTFNSIDDYARENGMYSYVYLFKDGEWYYCNSKREWLNLKDKLVALGIVD